MNATAATCLLENEWGCIFDENNRMPPITCYSRRWLNTTESVNTDHSDATKMERWRNGDWRLVWIGPSSSNSEPGLVRRSRRHRYNNERSGWNFRKWTGMLYYKERHPGGLLFQFILKHVMASHLSLFYPEGVNQFQHGHWTMYNVIQERISK